MKYEIPTIQIHVVRDGAPIETRTPDVAAKILRQICCADDPTVERFAVLCLDGASQVRSAPVVAMGGRSAICLKAADVLKPPIIAGASAIVLGHNHPSGDPKPSHEDLAMTRTLMAAGKLVGIQVVDHVIVTDNGRSYSMSNHGDIDE